MTMNLDQYVSQAMQTVNRANSELNDWGIVQATEHKIPIYLSTAKPYTHLADSSSQPQLSQLQECAKQHHFLEQEVIDHVLQKMLQVQSGQILEDNILVELHTLRLAFTLLKRFYREKGCPIS